MMGLFGTHKASHGTMQEVAHMVHNYYASRGLQSKNFEIDNTDGCGWWLKEGAARVYIFIQDAPGGPVIRITAPIVYIPEKNQTEFFRHLLDINANLTCCAMAASEDTVLVVAQRHIAQLDQEELDDMVWNVAYVADLLENKLMADFGARQYDGRS